jgi:regulatory protein
MFGRTTAENQGHRPKAISGTITAVEPQERAAGRRVSVFLDGVFAFGLAVEIAAGLETGRMLTARESVELQQRDLGQRALDRALNFLSYRPRTVRELRTRLSRGGFDPDTVDRTVARLTELKLLDDSAFATVWVEQRRAHNPRGAALLRQELRRKGADQQAIADVLEGVELGEEDAVAAGRKKARLLRKHEQAEFERRLGAFLVRRGFSWEQARGAVRQLWSQRQDL